MYKFIILFSFAFISSVTGFAQHGKTIPSPTEVHWYSIEEAQELLKQQPRKIMIDAYTDWCGWCKRMDATTFSNPNIAAYLNQYYYPVKLDAETLDTISFNGKDYVNSSAGKLDANGRPIRKPSHDLAQELLKGRMSYPTIVFLDENLANLSPVPGYRSATDIEPLLIYFGENVYKSSSWEVFEKNFNKSFKDSIVPDTSLVKWYSLQEALDLNEKTPKKIFVDMHVYWSTLSRMMYMTTYSDPEIAKYLNENYYPVRFDALSTDTIHAFGIDMAKENKGHPFHEFAVTVLKGKMQFPILLFMDEENHLITPVPEYRTAKNLEPILHFFKDDSYKTVSFEDYLKKFEGLVKDE